MQASQKIPQYTWLGVNTVHLGALTESERSVVHVADSSEVDRRSRLHGLLRRLQQYGRVRVKVRGM